MLLKEQCRIGTRDVSIAKTFETQSKVQEVTFWKYFLC